MKRTTILLIAASLIVAPLVYAQEASNESAAKNASEKNDAADGDPPTASAPAQSSVNLPAGSAKGSLTFDGATAELKFASAFVDQKDDRKPVLLLLSDQKLPTEKWKSEFDIMLYHTKWNGLVFFLDKDGRVFRSDVHMNDRQTGVAGLWELKLDNPSSKDLTGTAQTRPNEKDKLDVTFHAVLQ
jgi:hypothetical protein